jgi:branched-chain amino acid transport system ATP-binding protein
VLEIENLAVRYGRSEVVRDVSLHVGQGEFVGLLGANGAGKTTTLKAIAGILRAQRGDVRLAGESVLKLDSSRRVRSGLVLVPEGRHLFPTMTVEENLRVAAEAIRRHGNDPISFDEVFELFPRLHERMGQRAGSLSGGEQQMVALGRGMLSRPKVLLLDEPSLGLAPALVDEVFDAISRLNANGLSVFMVEQDAGRAFDVCGRAYVIERGTSTLEGTVAALSEDPRVTEAFLGTVSPNDISTAEDR